jgi:hypothetical protein
MLVTWVIPSACEGCGVELDLVASNGNGFETTPRPHQQRI